MIIHSLEWEDVYPHLSPYHKVGRSSKGRDLFPGSFLWMVTCGVWRINSHVKMLRRRQRRTRSPPQESKVLQVCVPVRSTASFPSETERGTRLGWNRRRFYMMCGSSSSGIEKVTEDSLASIFFLEIQPSPGCLAHNQYSAWIPSLGPLHNLRKHTFLWSSFSRTEH